MKTYEVTVQISGTITYLIDAPNKRVARSNATTFAELDFGDQLLDGKWKHLETLESGASSKTIETSWDDHD